MGKKEASDGTKTTKDEDRKKLGVGHHQVAHPAPTLASPIVSTEMPYRGPGGLASCRVLPLSALSCDSRVRVGFGAALSKGLRGAHPTALGLAQPSCYRALPYP